MAQWRRIRSSHITRLAVLRTNIATARSERGSEARLKLPFYDEIAQEAGEAAHILPVLLSATYSPPSTLLELGCGGGSLAHHFKGRLRLTLSDWSTHMLAISRTVNPECEHIVGDMRSLDLGRQRTVC